MLRKGLIAALFVAAMSVTLFADEVVVRVSPPRAVVETRVAPPGPGFVWTPGYQRWDGRAYVWVPGAWMRPPRPHSRWVAARWVRRHGGWVLMEGHWR